MGHGARTCRRRRGAVRSVHRPEIRERSHRRVPAMRRRPRGCGRVRVSCVSMGVRTPWNMFPGFPFRAVTHSLAEGGLISTMVRSSMQHMYHTCPQRTPRSAHAYRDPGHCWAETSRRRRPSARSIRGDGARACHVVSSAGVAMLTHTPRRAAALLRVIPATEQKTPPGVCR